jgi:hypothetical protein
MRVETLDHVAAEQDIKAALEARRRGDRIAALAYFTAAALVQPSARLHREIASEKAALGLKD